MNNGCWYCRLSRHVRSVFHQTRWLWYKHLININLITGHRYNPLSNGCGICWLNIRDWKTIPSCSGKDWPWAVDVDKHGNTGRPYQVDPERN